MHTVNADFAMLLLVVDCFAFNHGHTSQSLAVPQRAAHSYSRQWSDAFNELVARRRRLDTVVPSQPAS